MKILMAKAKRLYAVYGTWYRVGKDIKRGLKTSI